MNAEGHTAAAMALNEVFEKDRLTNSPCLTNPFVSHKEHEPGCNWLML